MKNEEPLMRHKELSNYLVWDLLARKKSWFFPLVQGA